MATNVGFTGSQDGMTNRQRDRVESTLRDLFQFPGIAFNHGLCIGADDEATAIANRIGYVTTAHPGDNSAKRGKEVSVVTHCPEDNLRRNRRIVRDSSVMVAAPRQTLEVLRSGTWATIRHALRSGVQTYIVWPDGRRSILDRMPAGGKSIRP